MILVVCLPCAFVIRVMPAQVTEASSAQEVRQLVGQASEFWPDKYPCPHCGLLAKALQEHDADPAVLQTLTLQDLTAQEAFAAFNGFGLPQEQRCALSSVEALLREQPVRRVLGKNVSGDERTIVDALELWDGTKVYFGAGAEGAVIYRVARPVSYAARILAEVDR